MIIEYIFGEFPIIQTSCFGKPPSQNEDIPISFVSCGQKLEEQFPNININEDLDEYLASPHLSACKEYCQNNTPTPDQKDYCDSILSFTSS